MYSVGLVTALFVVSSTAVSALAAGSEAPPLAARHKLNNTHSFYQSATSLAPVLLKSDFLSEAGGHWQGELNSFEPINVNTEIGWRLQGNPSSAYRLRTVNSTSTGPFLGWNTTADGDNDLPEVKVDCNAEVDYHASSSTAASVPHARELATDDADAAAKYGPWTTIPTIHTIFIRNGGSHHDCPGSETLSIHSNFTYLDGTTNTVTGTDYINMGAVSANLTQIDIAITEYPAFSATFHFDPSKPWPLQMRKRTDSNVTYTVESTQAMDIWLCGDRADGDD